MTDLRQPRMLIGIVDRLIGDEDRLVEATPVVQCVGDVLALVGPTQRPQPIEPDEVAVVEQPREFPDGFIVWTMGSRFRARAEREPSVSAVLDHRGRRSQVVGAAAEASLYIGRADSFPLLNERLSSRLVDLLWATVAAPKSDRRRIRRLGALMRGLALDDTRHARILRLLFARYADRAARFELLVDEAVDDGLFADRRSLIAHLDDLEGEALRRRRKPSVPAGVSDRLVERVIAIERRIHNDEARLARVENRTSRFSIPLRGQPAQQAAPFGPLFGTNFNKAK